MIRNSDYLEAHPLRGVEKFPVRPRYLKGPSRVARLCFLGILLPTCLVSVPLYLRYRVYIHQLYPLAMSDMRVIDGRISTTWCQRQMVNANTTFNAFLLPDSPKISDNIETLSMVRHLRLDDDMKEYWGFYLIKGSIVKVSTCVRWQGASLIVIRGHKHLHECAYIGDDSSEEEEELQELRSDSPANRPSEMRRHRPDVKFLHPPTDNQSYLINHMPETHYEDDTDVEGDIRKLLGSLQEKIMSLRKSSGKQTSGPLDLVSTTKEENSKLTSQEIINDILEKLEKLGAKDGDILDKLTKKLQSKEASLFPSNAKIINITKRELFVETAGLSNSAQELEDVGAEVELNPDGIADDKGTVTEDTVNDLSNSEFWSSFSSSEEALLNCAGLILNLPLTPHHKCSANLTDKQAEETYIQNTITYKVPLNGYYFFVFSSENEVQQNYLRVQFELEKVTYDVSAPLAACKNTSVKCALDLGFLSGQKVVMQLPLHDRDSFTDGEFVAESECEPRSALYAVFVIAVPVVFILFAFT